MEAYIVNLRNQLIDAMSDILPFCYYQPESQPLNPFGSTTSLDVDRIQRKNDARLRRLHNLNGNHHFPFINP